jgi:hypothetical protein
MLFSYQSTRGAIALRTEPWCLFRLSVLIASSDADVPSSGRSLRFLRADRC